MTQPASNWLDDFPPDAAADILFDVLSGGLLFRNARGGEEVVFDPAEVDVWIDDYEPAYVYLAVTGYMLRVHRDRFGTAE